MMQWLNALLSDGDGKPSSMRCMAWLALFAAIGLAFMSKDPTLIGVFLAYSGGGHIAGKYVESTTRPDTK